VEAKAWIGANGNSREATPLNGNRTAMSTQAANKGRKPRRARTLWVPLKGAKPMKLDVDPSEVKKVSEQVLRERQRSGPVRATPLVP
jgi:hypothetical protein